MFRTASQRSTLRLMRFDGARPSVTFKDIHPSLKPVLLPSDFTPFPLPKFDQSLGFGPTRLRDVPDVERAKVAIEAEHQAKKISFVDLMEDTGSDAVASPLHSDHSTPTSAPEDAPVSSVETTDAGYVREPGYPLIDRVTCIRSVEDLLHQFLNHTGVEGKAAAINDIASSLERLSTDELRHVFDTLAEQFDPDGNGIQFFARRCEGYMLPFHVSSPLHWAFRGLLSSLDDHFMTTELQRLKEDPSLLASMLLFYSRVKIFQPNLWHSADSHRQSNTTDSYGPKNHNRHYLHKNLFEELFVRIQELLCPLEGVSSMTSKLSCMQLADLFSAFVALRPDGSVPGMIVDELVQQFTVKIRDEQKDSRLRDLAIGKMCFAARLGNITVAALETLADSCEHLVPELLFSLSHRRPKLHISRVKVMVEKAMAEVDRLVLNHSTDAAIELLDGVRELLQSVDDRDEAISISKKLKIGIKSLELLSNRCATIARSLDDSCGRKLGKVRTYHESLQRIGRLTALNVVHASVVAKDVTPLVAALRQNRSGSVATLVTFQTLHRLHFLAANTSKTSLRERCRVALKALAFDVSKGLVYFVPFEDELLLRDAGVIADEDILIWTIAAAMIKDVPLVKPRMLIGKGDQAERPYHFLKSSSHVAFVEKDTSLFLNRKVINRDGKEKVDVFSSRELVMQARLAKPLMKKIRDRPSTIRKYNTRRATLAYRRDRPLFDKYHVHGRNTIAGFGRGGATDHDLRGLGYHTPDHTQTIS